MTARQLRERLTTQQLKEIDESQFPSATMLNRLETSLREREALADYAEILVKKVERTRFPSTALLNRIDAVLARLEQQERHEQRRTAAAE